MSRCFPFPPPGYEKKARADEESLSSNKEKQKEKKHKKDKKDREKREGKEKKEKERSEEKQKEKKERKDKSKDKKDRHKEKERKSVLGEKDSARPPEHCIAEKLSLSQVQNAQSSDAKVLLELGKRTCNSDERSAEKLGPTLLQSTQSSDAKFLLELGKRIGNSGERSVEKLVPTPVQSGQSSDAKFLLELGKRIGNSDERSAEKNLLVHRFVVNGQENYEMPGKDNGEDQRTVNGRQNGAVAANGFIKKFEGVHRRTLEGVGRLVEQSVMRAEQGENSKQIIGESRVGEEKERDPGKKIRVGLLAEKPIQKRTEQEESYKQERDSGTKIRVGLLAEKPIEKRTEQEDSNKQERDPAKKIRVGLLAEKPIEKRTEQEDSNKQKNGESRTGKHKDKDPERNSKSKDKKRDKEKEKEERKKEKKKEKELKKEQLKQRRSGKSTADGDNMKSASDFLNEKPGPSDGKGNLGKRKEFENGFLHETDIRPSKLPRPTVSSAPQTVENGWMVEPSSKTAIRFVDDLERNKKISSSPSVPRNGKIMEPLPRTVPPSTNQVMLDERKPAPSKTAIRIVAEFGEGNKQVTSSLPGAANGKVMEPSSRLKAYVSPKEIVENGRKQEPAKVAVGFIAGEREKVASSSPISVHGGTRSRSEAPPLAPNLPDLDGRKLQLSRSGDQPTTSSGGNVVVINHKVGSNEIRVDNKDEGLRQPNVSLKKPSSPCSSKQDQLASGGGNMVVINHKAADHKEIKVNGNGKEKEKEKEKVKKPPKPKPPHADLKFLDSILSVPQVDEWCDIDDQEWLQQGAKRPKVEVEGTAKQVVWAEALRLDSADIVALPYVIPY